MNVHKKFHESKCIFFEIARCAISAVQINKTRAEPGNESEQTNMHDGTQKFV